MARVSMTCGVMPTREQFDAACDEPDPECGLNGSVAATGFRFGNDRRVGDVTLSPDELWTELQSAHAEWESGDEDAGTWCSLVLGCLGFEWI
jgi:hypothetical protein